MKKKVKIEISNVVGVEQIIVETKNIMQAGKYNGSKYLFELDELEIFADNDIDFYIFMKGEPKTTGKMVLKVGGKKEKNVTLPKFDKNGWAYYNKAIKLSELKNED